MKLSLAAAAALALPAFVASQSLETVLEDHGDCDIFLALIKISPPLAGILNSTVQRTVLAPTDKAILDYQSAKNITAIAELNQAIINAVLTYHLVPGSYPAANMGADGGQIVTTSLTDPTYSNLGEGVGNVIYTNETSSNSLFKRSLPTIRGRQTNGTDTGNGTDSNALYIYSGSGDNITVTEGDIPYDHGIVHIVNGLLTLPSNVSATAGAVNLNSLAAALTAGNLTDITNARASTTLLAPSDLAFANAANATAADITEALQYGTFFDFLAYSPRLTNGQTITQSSISGFPAITVKQENGALYFNDAKVLQGNIITENGVLHIIDKVLFPKKNTTVTIPPPPQVTGAGEKVTVGGSMAALVIGFVGLSLLW